MRHAGEERISETEVAVQLGELTKSYPLPEDMSVAIFVFRDEPEAQTLHVGYLSMTPIGRLRRWIEAWLQKV
jgi:hypothetical protein